MKNSNSTVSLSFLKQKARQIKRDKSLKQHQALDEAARQYGFTNYKNYLNTKDTSIDISSLKESYLKKIYLEEDMLKRFEIAVTYIQCKEVTFPDFFEILKIFQHSNDAFNSLCKKWDLEKEIKSFLLDDFQSDESKEIELYAPYFTAKEVNLHNTIYSMEDSIISVDGDYELKLEFDGEVPEQLKSEPHFYREPMFGNFEIKIDKDKKIALEHQSIGWYD